MPFLPEILSALLKPQPSHMLAQQLHWMHAGEHSPGRGEPGKPGEQAVQQIG